MVLEVQNFLELQKEEKTNESKFTHYKKYKILSISFNSSCCFINSSILCKGLNYGIDFTGGNLFQLKYNDKKITLTEINENLDKII